jgi:riboflavin synthase
VFTGLVVERGRLSGDPRESSRGGVRLEIGHSAELGARLSIGASLAVAGVCLTVVELTAQRCAVELSRETLARTRLGRLRSGDQVNLEPPLRVGDPLGGHFVQGHVDGLVRLRRRADAGEHSEFEIDSPPSLGRYVVEKGSVALDGVSLTVAAVLARGFSVALVPHTLEVTTLGAARPGTLFHFEADVLAKYVERALTGPLERAALVRERAT